jgi:hypothetical protein
MAFNYKTIGHASNARVEVRKYESDATGEWSAVVAQFEDSRACAECPAVPDYSYAKETKTEGRACAAFWRGYSRDGSRGPRS